MSECESCTRLRAEVERLTVEAGISYAEGYHDGDENGGKIKREFIDKMEADIEKLRAALEELYSMCLRQEDFNDDRDGLTLSRARAALQQEVK